jgi:hypothetical protein
MDFLKNVSCAQKEVKKNEGAIGMEMQIAPEYFQIVTVEKSRE